ncbi:S8 family peptidase [Romboutsia hominis]|uniref:Subtilisin-like serine germination related protease n=1 Tax=Romboutsia hominis TaxID=1507512 RepID=A0A2P2BPP8_9FIRM|nr:S8 family peptidase [Romboutsia hominis]CEI72318.1 Subtilisin-like serine germination related protease [Romboutsia hominis]
MKKDFRVNYTLVGNVVYGEGFEEDLKKLGDKFKFEKISDTFGILFMENYEVSNFEYLFNLKSIYRLEPSVRLSSLVNINRGTFNGVVANEDIGANFIKENPNLSISGKGVIIGIADSGIDYLHPDFIYPDKTSKILYLWDQTKEGKPPNGFYIGTEYNREDINKAILENDGSLSVDEEGTGTMISGICAGLGNLNPEYKGVAEESDLIIVKLKKIENDYNNGYLIAAMEYMNQKARQERKPLVNNISLGNNSLVGISSRLSYDKLFFEHGLCQVIGAGNESNTQTHASGKLGFNGDIQDVEIDIGEDEEILNIELWVNRPDKIDLYIISPSGEESQLAFVSDFNIISGLFNFENTRYTISFSYPFSYSGQQRTVITLANAKKGIWKIRLIGAYITNGIYNMYLENRKFIKPGTKFSKSDPENTINYPSTLNDVISVGAYDTINNSLWASSSRGPTIESVLKPDIVAPGVNIIGPYINKTYATGTGTGIASAYTSGAVALFLQYIQVNGNYENKAFVQKIRTYLSAGARRNQDVGYPNYSYGYGELDIRGLFEQLR